MKDIKEIKKALADKLKSVVDQDVYYEDAIQTHNSNDYWFVELLPVDITTIQNGLSEASYMINITCSIEEPTNAKYMNISTVLDQMIRPCFHFGSRHITVDGVSIKIIDSLMHYEFKLAYIPEAETENPETTATQLDITIK